MAYEMNQVCLITLGEEQPWALDTYKAKGGYETWEQILAGKLTPEQVIDPIALCTTLSAGMLG